MRDLSRLTGYDTGQVTKVVTGFDRHDINISKAGAYYTDTAHARSIGTALVTDGEAAVLEPSCGNAVAVATCVKAMDGEGAIYGVELRADAAQEARRTTGVKAVVNADFLSGVVISNNAFPLIFANPPYGLTDDGKSRLETEFLKNCRKFSSRDGLLVWIVPAQCLAEKRHAKEILSCWNIEKMFRFRKGEYEKYHQLVLFLRRGNARKEVSEQEVTAFTGRDFTSVPELPVVFDEKERLHIAPCTKQVTTFRSRFFDAAEASAFLARFDTSELYKIVQKRVTARQQIRPPMEVSTDSMYLSLVSGLGQGLAGEEGHVHLQRGNVKRITEETEEDAGDRKVTVRKRTMARAYVTIVEPTGVTRLE